MKKILFLLFLCTIFGCNRPLDPPQDVVINNDSIQTIITLVNAERAKQGITYLSVNSKLMAEANRYAGVMAKQGSLSHTLEGDFGERIKRSGYAGNGFGENIAMGYNTPNAVVTGWMNSSGHRDNILNSRYKETGVGIQKNGNKIYYCQIFGTPR